MATHDDAADRASDPLMSLVTEKQTVRRPLGNLYVLAFVLVPVLLTAAVGFLQASAVEDDLESDARAALAAEKVKGVDLELAGRVVTAKVPTGQDPDTVEKAISGVAGVAEVEVVRVYASAAEAKACKDLQKKIDRATDNQRIPFSGSSTRLTPAGEAMVREVGKLLDACGPAVVTVGGHTDSHTSNGSTISLQRARLMVRMLRNAGVEPERLLPRGYGDQFPVDEGDGPAAQAANQRGSIAVESS